jgi:hypothetical protein
MFSVKRILAVPLRDVFYGKKQGAGNLAWTVRI